MKTLRRNASLVPLVGAVTAAATAVGASAPMVAASSIQVDDGLSAAALRGAGVDGTYESCSAYFAFGKEEGFADVVGFDVEVDNPVDDSAPSVGDGVDVVLVIETEGGTIECEPFEITEEQWDELLDGLDEIIDLPPYPGDGHYVYPSVGLGAFIDDFGEVQSVGFRVVGVPDGLTLVSPTGVQPLAQNFLDPGIIEVGDIDERVLAVVDEAAGPAAVAAFVDAIDACIDEEDPVVDADLEAAVDALIAYLGIDEPDIEIDCSTLAILALFSSWKASVVANAEYTEPIDLAGPPSTTTTVAPTTAAPAAATATPRFTG
jgi:hypothetical protein